MNSYMKTLTLFSESSRSMGAQPYHTCLENIRFFDYYAVEYDMVMEFHPVDEDERINVKWTDQNGTEFEWCIDPDSTYGGWWRKTTQDYESSGVLETCRLFGRTCVVGYDGVMVLPQPIEDSLTKNLPNLI
jgi:hypothetical protein